MLFDQSLNWKAHIEKIYVTAQRAINILKPMAFVSWGADPRTIKMLYKSIVRSHFDYGSIFYADGKISNLNKLNVIQNKGLRLILGAMNSTPINYH